MDINKDEIILYMIINDSCKKQNIFESIELAIKELEKKVRDCKYFETYSITKVKMSKKAYSEIYKIINNVVDKVL